MKKIALITGHSKLSQGAKNFLGEHEYSFNSRIAQLVKHEINTRYQGVECLVFYRDDGGLRQVARDIKAWGEVDVSLSMHFNAFKDRAYGCECLISKTYTVNEHSSQSLAFNLVNAIFKTFDIKPRHNNGLKWVSGGDRGAYNLELMEDAGAKIALLLEPCFANFETDESQRFFRDEQAYVDLLVTSLTDFLEVKKDTLYPEIKEDQLDMKLSEIKLSDAEKLEKIREILG